VGTNPSSVSSADFNGDGKADIVTANMGGNISILLGTGTGIFPAPVNYGTSSGPRSIITADFNGDGKTDIVTANNGGFDASVLLNTTPFPTTSIQNLSSSDKLISVYPNPTKDLIKIELTITSNVTLTNALGAINL
jgi:hypothetical protein